MATEFCQECKQSHPGRVCDYDEKGERAETVAAADSEQEPSEGGCNTGDETGKRRGRNREPAFGHRQYRLQFVSQV